MWSGMASDKGHGSEDQQAPPPPWMKCEAGQGQLEQEGAWPSLHHLPVPAPAPLPV